MFRIEREVTIGKLANAIREVCLGHDAGPGVYQPSNAATSGAGSAHTGVAVPMRLRVAITPRCNRFSMTSASERQPCDTRFDSIGVVISWPAADGMGTGARSISLPPLVRT